MGQAIIQIPAEIGSVFDAIQQPNEGNHLRNAPKNAASASLVCDYPLGSGCLNARADYIYKDDAYQAIENSEEAKMQ